MCKIKYILTILLRIYALQPTVTVRGVHFGVQQRVRVVKVLLAGAQPAHRALASRMLVVYMLAHGAAIELQRLLEHHGVGANRAVTYAFGAVSVLSLVGVHDCALVDPMVGVCVLILDPVLLRADNTR